MFSSQNIKDDTVLAIFKNSATVFKFSDVSLLTGESNFQSLNRKLNYAVRRGKLLNPRKGLYAKPDYNPEELACKIYTPSYISLEYVLQKAGIIFQYDTQITLISYLSRDIQVENRTYSFRKIKSDVLYNISDSIVQKKNVNMANAERAFLDMLYLEKNAYFDNLNPLNKKQVYELLPMYKSKALNARVNKMLENG
jgi:hypothetical protein